LWEVKDGALQLARDETAEVGEILICDPAVVHSMNDDEGTEPLITLHMYTTSIDHMVVYNKELSETLVVEGSCGAWVPSDQPQMIRSSVPGIIEPSSVVNRSCHKRMVM
jgi:hypothetical protein